MRSPRATPLKCKQCRKAPRAFGGEFEVCVDCCAENLIYGPLDKFAGHAIAEFKRRKLTLRAAEILADALGKLLPAHGPVWSEPKEPEVSTETPGRINFP